MPCSGVSQTRLMGDIVSGGRKGGSAHTLPMVCDMLGLRSPAHRRERLLSLRRADRDVNVNPTRGDYQCSRKILILCVGRSERAWQRWRSCF